jgi:hypothetical protein
LLKAGDKGEAVADIAVKKTAQGNLYAAGWVACERAEPLPRTTLFASLLSKENTKFSAVLPDAEKRPGWGGGAFGMVGRDGWALGPGLGLPPLRFLGIQFELSAGVGFGPGGPVGSGMLLVRP